MKQSLALSIHQRPARRTASEIMANSRGQRRLSAVLRGLVWLAAFLTAAVILLLVGYILITGIPKGIKTKLISKSGYMGYTLEETGTIVAWDSEMGDKDLVLGASYTKKGTAYSKANKKDPVFKKTGSGLLQYTNSLVGYTDAQCEPDLAMRPYMILKNAAGETVTLYGGTVHRSIGYIAYQNRNAFKPGSAAYEYIWGIIRAAYGNTYDAEYKKN